MQGDVQRQTMNNNSDITGVVFDLDGLLLDTESMYWESFDKAASDFDIDFPKSFYIELVGGPESRTQALLKKRFGESFPLEDFESSWRKQFGHIVEAGRINSKPGVTEVLQMLTDRQLPIAVATSSHRELVEKTMHAASIRDFFEHVVCGDEVDNGKPAPDIYLAACQRIDREPGQCLSFEDSDVGLRAAVTAGLRCVLIPDMKAPTDHSLGLAYETFSSMHEAVSWLSSELVD